jgi:hypothetical protein
LMSLAEVIKSWLWRRRAIHLIAFLFNRSGSSLSLLSSLSKTRDWEGSAGYNNKRDIASSSGMEMATCPAIAIPTVSLQTEASAKFRRLQPQASHSTCEDVSKLSLV